MWTLKTNTTLVTFLLPFLLSLLLLLLTTTTITTTYNDQRIGRRQNGKRKGTIVGLKGRP